MNHLNTSSYQIHIDRKVVNVGTNGESQPEFYHAIDIEGKAFEDEKRQYVYMVQLLQHLREIEYAVGTATDEKIAFEYDKIKGRVAKTQDPQPEEDVKP